MAHVLITLAVIVLSLVLFATNVVPAAVVAVGASLVLFVTGVLTLQQTFEGFGDPVVILIAALLAIASGLENAGVGAWAGQFLMRHGGKNDTLRLISIMVAGAVFSALIGMNGAVAAMLPVAVVVAVKTRISPSRVMLPLAFACLTGGNLTLLGTPINVIATTQAQEAGIGQIGFFEWAVLGAPQFLGTVAIIVLLGRRWLPERRTQSIPADFSTHSRTLVEQYRLEEGLHYLRVHAGSPLIGKARGEVDLSEYPGLSMVGFLEPDGRNPLRREEVAAEDLVLVRGDPEMAGRLAADLHLGIRDRGETGPVADTLLSRDSGLAEVVIPQRSTMIGQPAFPGMTTGDGDLMVLAVHRGSDDLSHQPATLQAGDHLLLQGTWKALDSYLSEPEVLVVDSPEAVRKQAVPLGKGAPAALAILALLFLLLVFNVVPATVAAVLCAALMVVTGVLSLPQLYRGIDWNAVILVGAMIAPATAMTETGAAKLIGDTVVDVFGGAGPYGVLLGLFLVATLLTQLISNTSSALIMIPVALAVGPDLGISPLPLVVGVAMGASSSFLTPLANAVSLVVYGPGGYKFADFWKLGLVVTGWTTIVTVGIVPIFWRF